MMVLCCRYSLPWIRCLSFFQGINCGFFCYSFSSGCVCVVVSAEGPAPFYDVRARLHSSVALAAQGRVL